MEVASSNDVTNTKVLSPSFEAAAEPSGSVPPYINEELFVRAITDGLGVCGARIVSQQPIERATANGDNYMSDVFRVRVRFACDEPVSTDRSVTVDPADGTCSVSLVIKSLPDVGHRGTIIRDLRAYEKEVTMFRTIVPRLSQLTHGTFFAARCYYATNVPERVIVFEDLRALGYANRSRQTGLDFDHCALVMEKIGRFHAASMRFAEEEPELLRDQFHFNMFNPDGEGCEDDIRNIFERGLETLIGVARQSWEGFDRRIVDKLERLVPVYVDRLRECMEQKVESDGGFRVLNHGDLWSNNLLFRDQPESEGDGEKHRTSTVEDVVFVDLQISFYTSPGLDLNYVLANCPNYATRDRLDELVDRYYASFSDRLRQLNYRPIPTRAQIEREIRRMEFFSLVSIVSVLPIVLMDHTDELVADIDSLIDGGEVSERAREIQYNGQNYQRIVRPMLIEFDRRGLLDA